jgi:hypothetical protein
MRPSRASAGIAALSAAARKAGMTRLDSPTWESWSMAEIEIYA